MSRNQPENLIKIFIFIFGAVLIFGFFIYIWMNYILPSYLKNRPSIESSQIQISSNKLSTFKSSFEVKNSEENRTSSLSQISESSQSVSTPLPSSQQIQSSSDNTFLDKGGRGDYQDQISAYDPIQ